MHVQPNQLEKEEEKLNPLALVFTLACAAQPNSFPTSMRLKKRNGRVLMRPINSPLKGAAPYLAGFVKKSGFQAAPFKL
jgi:hypothetical protein